MPDTKISALAAVGAAADAQEFPVNDAGATKKITLGVVDAYILRALHVPSTALAANSVTDTKLRDSAGTSVIGKAGAGAGDPADIVAGADNQIFGRRGGALTFASVATAELAANILSADAAGRGKMQNGFFDAATVTAKFAAGSVTATEIANRTRKFFVPAVGAYNATDATVINKTDTLGAGPDGYIFPDLKTCESYGNFYLPSDWVSNLTVTLVVNPFASGNLRARHDVYYGAVGQSRTTHTDTLTATTAVTINVLNEEITVTPANLAAGDYIHLKFTRYGLDALDTIGDSISFAGWLVSYTADS